MLSKLTSRTRQGWPFPPPLFLASTMKQEKETKDYKLEQTKTFLSVVYAKISKETTNKVTGSKSFKRK